MALQRTDQVSLSLENQPEDDIGLLFRILPLRLQEALRRIDSNQLLEVVLDLGRVPEARLQSQALHLGDEPLDLADISFVEGQVGEFGGDNRVGIPRTLHRISAIRNRRGTIVGLTLRVGRALFGTIDLLRDLLESGKNILLLGRPGIGKTTKLREMARVLADELNKRVIVVDTSNEIGGDGDIPHPAIGSARRMQVARPDQQHTIMIEAVENHMPEVIIVDEIGTQAEAAAARTIAERGVQLIGTAHGTTLENLVMNPTLSDLVGGVHVVTLSDEEARRQHRPKTVSERKAPPTFDVVVELVDWDEVIVHDDTAMAVDVLLGGRIPRGESRSHVGGDSGRSRPPPRLVTPTAPGRPGLSHRQQPQARLEEQPQEQVEENEDELYPATPLTSSIRENGVTRIYPYLINRNLLDRVIRNLNLAAKTVDHPDGADIILSLRSEEDNPQLEEICRNFEIPLHLLKKDSATCMKRSLQDLFSVLEGLETDEVREALQETEHAIQRVMNEGVEVALAPRTPPVRKMQHRIISRYHLETKSIGRESARHLVIRPP